MKVEVKNMRYYVTDSNYIPLHEQRPDGYTKLQAIDRVQREMKECVEFFGGEMKDYKSWFHIVDTNFNIIVEFEKAF